jgi:hypothetical protein
MAQARVEIGQCTNTPCLCCGDMPHEQVRLVTEKSKVAWIGCSSCWPLVYRRHLIMLRERCRKLDGLDSNKILHVG